MEFLEKKSEQKPKGIVCYICGREYFLRSIKIHLQYCKNRWV